MDLSGCRILRDYRNYEFFAAKLRFLVLCTKV